MREEFIPLLEEINKIRAIYSLAPLEDFEKGSPQSACYCPISNSIRKDSKFVYVATTPDFVRVSFDELSDGTYHHSKLIRNFTYLFDSYQLPEYRSWAS